MKKTFLCLALIVLILVSGCKSQQNDIENLSNGDISSSCKPPISNDVVEIVSDDAITDPNIGGNPPLTEEIITDIKREYIIGVWLDHNSAFEEADAICFFNDGTYVYASYGFWGKTTNAIGCVTRRKGVWELNGNTLTINVTAQRVITSGKVKRDKDGNPVYDEYDELVFEREPKHKIETFKKKPLVLTYELNDFQYDFESYTHYWGSTKGSAVTVNLGEKQYWRLFLDPEEGGAGDILESLEK